MVIKKRDLKPESGNVDTYELFLLFRNKARNAGRSRKIAGNKSKCGISRTIAGRVTSMVWYSAGTDLCCCKSTTVVNNCTQSSRRQSWHMTAKQNHLESMLLTLTS